MWFAKQYPNTFLQWSGEDFGAMERLNPRCPPQSPLFGNKHPTTLPYTAVFGIWEKIDRIIFLEFSVFHHLINLFEQNFGTFGFRRVENMGLPVRVYIRTYFNRLYSQIFCYTNLSTTQSLLCRYATAFINRPTTAIDIFFIRITFKTQHTVFTTLNSSVTLECRTIM